MKRDTTTRRIYTKHGRDAQHTSRTSKARNSNTRVTISGVKKNTRTEKIKTKRNSSKPIQPKLASSRGNAAKNIVTRKREIENITTKSFNLRNKPSKTTTNLITAKSTLDFQEGQKSKLESRKRRFSQALENSSSKRSNKRQITSKTNMISTKKVKKQSWEAERSSPVSKSKKAPKRLTFRNRIKPEPVQSPPTPLETEPESSSESESESSDDDRETVPNLNVHASKGALVVLRNIPKSVTAKQLMNELLSTMQIEEVSLQVDRSGSSTGIAELFFYSTTEARDCMKRLRKTLYRGNNLYTSLIGTNTNSDTTPTEDVEVIVIAQKPKKRKRTRHRRKEKKEKMKIASVHAVEKPENSPPCKLRMVTTTSIQADTRPWNWGTQRVAQSHYDMTYIPPAKEEDGVCYHVTMKDASSAS